MRCKHCQKIFQARSKTSSSVSANVPVAQPALAVKAGPAPIAKPAVAAPAPIAKPAVAAPVAQPATAVQAGFPVGLPPKPPSNNPFGFDEPEPPAGAPAAPTPAAPKKRKKGKGWLLLVLTFFFLFLLGGGGAAFVVYKAVITPESKHRPAPLAKGDGSRTDSVSVPVRPNPDADGRKDADKKIDTPPADGMPKTKDPKIKPLPPPKKDANKDQAKKDGIKKGPVAGESFPRRALLISVNNYLMFSTVHYGSAQGAAQNYPGSSTASLRERLTRPPMNFPFSQVTELSDDIPAAYKTAKAHSTQKSVLESTITDFVAGAREQDRILIFFAGHAANVEDVSYLVPIDGNKEKVESLLPLKWVYDQMAKCKAQQKILVLDVFRFSPSRGFELPSPGEGDEGKMPEGFDKDLLNPPAGVQVWSSCIKEQSSVELDLGSAFMQAMCNSMQGGGKMAGIATPAQPIPIEDLVKDVNDRLKQILTAEKRTQVSRLTGKASDAVVAYDSKQPLPPAVELKPPTVAGGEAAGGAVIERILEELRLMPPVRDTRAGDLNLLRAQNLPAFSAKKIDAYKADGYQNITEFYNKYKGGKEAFAKEFPLRAAYFDTLEELQESRKISMRETLPSPIDPKRKAAFLLEQAPLGISIFKLKQALAAMKEVSEKRDAETNKRWQANFDYMHARLLSRLMYLYEYNYTLGQIRADNLPELAPGQSGWRIGISGPKLNVTEVKAKAYAKEVTKLWKRIQTEYPDTPWALLAQRESMIALGLAWKGKSD